MDALNLHLIINHLPVFALFFGLLATIWFYFSRARTPLIILVGLFVVGALGAVVATQTGEAIRSQSERADINEHFLETHQTIAESAQWTAIALGVASVALGYFSRRDPTWIGRAILALCLLAVLANFLMIRAAFLGGEIRPAEMRDSQD